MILNIIYSIITVINYFYLKGLMKYKFISPAKCNFMIGIINVPLIILIYFIISFTPLGNINNDYYYDNIFELFKKMGNIDAKNIIILILLPLIYGILNYLLIKTVYEYTIFHLFIPFIVESFMKNIIKNLGKLENFFLISSFFVELIMILIFVEIIEINCCGLSENLKRNIHSRAIIESSFYIENVDNDEIYERNDKEMSTKKY